MSTQVWVFLCLCIEFVLYINPPPSEYVCLILSAVHLEDCISCDHSWCSQLLHIYTGSDHAGCIPRDTMVLPQDSKGDQEAGGHW